MLSDRELAAEHVECIASLVRNRELPTVRTLQDIPESLPGRDPTLCQGCLYGTRLCRPCLAHSILCEHRLV